MIFRIAIVVLMGLCIEAGYQYGKQEVAKQCAVVPGEQVVSTTANTCTYATSYGRAIKVRSVK